MRPIGFPDDNHPIGAADWQRLKQHGVNDAEHRGIWSDSESDCEDCDRGKTGILREGAEGIPHRGEYIEARTGGCFPGCGKSHLVSD